MRNTTHRLLWTTIAILALVASPLSLADFDNAMSQFRAGKYHEAAAEFQELVDTFNGLGLHKVSHEELVRLIVEPERLFTQKVDEMADQLGADGAAFRESMQSIDFAPVSAVEAELMQNPYTIHQAFSFMEAAPLLKIYSLVDGAVIIDEGAARMFTEQERLYPPDFDMDSLAVWDTGAPGGTRTPDPQVRSPTAPSAEARGVTRRWRAKLHVPSCCWLLTFGDPLGSSPDTQGWAPSASRLRKPRLPIAPHAPNPSSRGL